MHAPYLSQICMKTAPLYLTELSLFACEGAPQARSQVSRGGKIDLEESRGTLSESIFHTIYHNNQMDNVCARKDLAF